MVEKKGIKDWDIRYEFVKRNKDFFKQTNHVFVNEYGINSTNIVDLACFNFNDNLIYGFEIKSEKDNLLRLDKQLTCYTTFFNFIYVISHEKHTKDVLEIINSSKHLNKVGVINVTSNLEFNELKRASLYKPFLDLFIHNLDLEEIVSLCESNMIPTQGRTKKNLISIMKRHITQGEIYEGLHNKLRKFKIKYCPKCGSTLTYNKMIGDSSIPHCYECGCIISPEYVHKM